MVKFEQCQLWLQKATFVYWSLYPNHNRLWILVQRMGGAKTYVPYVFFLLKTIGSNRRFVKNWRPPIQNLPTGQYPATTDFFLFPFFPANILQMITNIEKDSKKSKNIFRDYREPHMQDRITWMHVKDTTNKIYRNFMYGIYTLKVTKACAKMLQLR